MNKFRRGRSFTKGKARSRRSVEVTTKEISERIHLNEFRRGRRFTQDQARSRRPVEVNTKDINERIHSFLLGDRRAKAS